MIFLILFTVTFFTDVVLLGVVHRLYLSSCCFETQLSIPQLQCPQHVPGTCNWILKQMESVLSGSNILSLMDYLLLFSYALQYKQCEFGLQDKMIRRYTGIVRFSLGF
jgi:hypothetical protein